MIDAQRIQEMIVTIEKNTPPAQCDLTDDARSKVERQFINLCAEIGITPTLTAEQLAATARRIIKTGKPVVDITLGELLQH